MHEFWCIGHTPHTSFGHTVKRQTSLARCPKLVLVILSSTWGLVPPPPPYAVGPVWRHSCAATAQLN